MEIVDDYAGVAVFRPSNQSSQNRNQVWNNNQQTNRDYATFSQDSVQ